MREKNYMDILATDEFANQNTWTWRRKENLKRENEALLMAALSNAIRTNYIKAKTDNTQQN